MVSGRFGIPRPGASPDPKIVVYFSSKVSDEDIKEIRREILRSELPLILVRFEEKVRDDALKFEMDGTATTHDTLGEIKEGIDNITKNDVHTVEVRCN